MKQVKHKVTFLLFSLILFLTLTGSASAEEQAKGSIGLTVSPSAFTIQDKVLQGTNSEDKSVKVIVKNVGNEKEFFKVIPKGYVLVKPDQFELQPNETKALDVFLRVTPDAPVGKRNDSFRVFAQGEITKSYNAELEVKVSYEITGNTLWVKLIGFLKEFGWLLILLLIVIGVSIYYIIAGKKKKKQQKEEQNRAMGYDSSKYGSYQVKEKNEQEDEKRE